LTQDPVPVAIPNNNIGNNGAVGGDDGSALGVDGNTGSNNTNQAIGNSDTLDDIGGDIMPVHLSALEDPNFDPDSIPDDEATIDPFNFGDTFLCLFTTVLLASFSATEDWARAVSFVCKN